MSLFSRKGRVLLFLICSISLSATCQDSLFTAAPNINDQLQDRFEQSLFLLKDLYEKVLALDHHFTSLKTHRDMLQLANPQAYAEFGAVRDMISSETREKHRVDLPEFLGENAIVAGAWTLVSLMFTNTSADEKSRALEEISCLLDFTMRMQADLNIIFYETEFLRESNAQLLTSCQMLFAESGKLVGYQQSLEKCRETDDWEELTDYVRQYFHALDQQRQDPTLTAMTLRSTNDVNFRIDRTAHFIQEYSTVISQGVRHYQKFARMTGKYEEEQLCVQALPEAFRQFQDDIALTLEKFQHAYQLPELYGSKLKALLYGSVLDRP